MLHIEILEKKFQQNLILENILLTIPNNGLYGVVGKNGSGKTTFFKCLTQLTDFKGEILFCGEKLPAENIAFIPTEPYLYDYLSVAEFYTFYSKLMQIPLQKNPIFNIDTSLLINELSTGMRKKTFINAVFQKSYRFYIFDEPFNGLDMESVWELQNIIMQLAQNHIVFVSSHLLESLQNCDAIFVLKDKNIQKILPEKYHTIKNIFINS